MVRIKWAMALALVVIGVAVMSVAAHGDVSACQEAARSLSPKGQHVLYLKAEHLLCLSDGPRVVWSGPASHGRKRGKKHFEGDGRTPEGTYTLAPARPSQRFGSFMLISYPDVHDVQFARARQKAPGGAVGIHGPMKWYAFLGTFQALVDHSDGCIVLDADSLGELSARVRAPTPITIVPALDL